MEDPKRKAACEVLGLEIAFTPEQVKPAYLKCSKACHPDKFQGQANEADKTAEFQAVNAAYLYLTSPEALEEGLRGQDCYTEALVAQIETFAKDFLPRVTELLAQRDTQIQTVTENTAALRETAEVYRGLSALLHSPRVLAFFQRFNRTPNRASPARESATELSAAPQTPTRTPLQTSRVPQTPKTRTVRRLFASPKTPHTERVAAPEPSPVATPVAEASPITATSRANQAPPVPRNLLSEWFGW